MPLHLLSKKSWNVYNPTAIARVRADEAAAAAREEAQEKRVDEYEAAKRLAILRGHTPPQTPSPVQEPQPGSEGHETHSHDDRRKRRRLAGEDDTDRDIRVAREAEEKRKQQRDSHQDKDRAGAGRKDNSDVPLLDNTGHIQLFAPPSVRDIKASKDAEAEAERKRKPEEGEDQYAMRFSDAAGFKRGLRDVPWYAKAGERAQPNGKHTGTEKIGEGVVGTDAFGNEDPGRTKRDAVRLSAADPMAAMMKAQKRLKEVERSRDTTNKERRRDLEELAALQEKEHRREAKRARNERERQRNDHGRDRHRERSRSNSPRRKTSSRSGPEHRSRRSSHEHYRHEHRSSRETRPRES